MKAKAPYFLIATLVLIIGSMVALGGHKSICPDDFATSEEATAAINAWTNSYFDAHPDASMSDWAQARRQFYVDNHCTASLERVRQAEEGKADPKTMERVNNAIQEAVNNPTH